MSGVSPCSLLFQRVVGDDFAQRASVVDVTDKTCEDTYLLAVAGSNQVLDAVADTVVAAQSGNVNLLDAKAVYHGCELRLARRVRHDGVFVNLHAVALRQYGRVGMMPLHGVEYWLVDGAAVGVLHEVGRPDAAVVLKLRVFGREIVGGPHNLGLQVGVLSRNVLCQAVHDGRSALDGERAVDEIILGIDNKKHLLRYGVRRTFGCLAVFAAAALGGDDGREHEK